VRIWVRGTTEASAAVERALERGPGVPVVLDPVMVAESGAVLLDESARVALRERLLPRATVVTPNIAEARVLAEAGEGTSPEALVRAVHALGAQAVVVTGGHREEVTDLFFDGEDLVEIPGERYPGGAAHGSGCTHSSALAAHLALGLAPVDAAKRAKEVASEAVRDGRRDIGAGAAPVDALGALGRRDGQAPLT